MRSAITAVLIFSSPLLGGCSGSRPDRAAVSGVIVYQGKPVSNVVVTFHPTAGGRPGVATTDAEGKFRLTTFEAGDGAVLGEHVVTIMPLFDAGPPTPDSAEVYAPPPEGFIESVVPKQYTQRDTSPLLYTVGDDEFNEFHIELQD